MQELCVSELKGGYLEQSLKLFMGQQQQLRDRVRDMVGVDPVGVVAGIAQKNFQRWKSIQEEIFRTFVSSSRAEDEAEEGESRPRQPRR